MVNSGCTWESSITFGIGRKSPIADSKMSRETPRALASDQTPSTKLETLAKAGVIAVAARRAALPARKARREGRKSLATRYMMPRTRSPADMPPVTTPIPFDFGARGKDRVKTR